MKKQLKWIEKRLKTDGEVYQSECAKHGISNLTELINQLNCDGYDIVKEDDGFEIKYVLRQDKQKNEKINPFDILQGLVQKKLYSKEDVEKSLDIYLLLQFLKNNKVTLTISEYLNQNWKMDIYQMYLFAYMMVPKSLGYIKWIKMEKKEINEEIKIFSKHYMCSYEIAERIYQMLSKDQIQFVIGSYDIGGKRDE